MRAWLTIRVPDFLATAPRVIAERLAHAQSSRRLQAEPAQLRAWEDSAALLRQALAGPEWHAAHLAFEYDMLRLERRPDAILLTDRLILVLEFKSGAGPIAPADRAQVEDYAQDLHDFHALSRGHPIQPLLVGTGTQTARPMQLPLPIAGAHPVVDANAANLADRLATLRDHAWPEAPALDASAWLAAPYKPVPTIVEAAARLFARNSVAEITTARADATNLAATTDAILNALDRARAKDTKVAIFVSGVPGAGKTLCGLNIVFGEHRREGTAFLTGNAPLVAVLREALALDRAGISLALGPSNDPERRRRSGALRQARHETHQALQDVHRFLSDNVARADPPAERVIVFDEAQRAWDRDKATRDGQNRKSRLHLSEPAHAVEIMGRHAGFAAIVALIGNGQEINTGEAGLAEWGAVLAAAPAWRAVAAPRALDHPEPSQRLATGAPHWLATAPALHLDVPIRSLRSASSAAWVDAVLTGDVGEARRLATAQAPPFFVTRDLAAAREALLGWTPGLRRAGFVRSSGARRLRAEGFDAQLLGTDEPVAWFLERWPDIRGSDALETAATEYACQGLELDAVGLAWGGDLIRAGGGWRERRFAGTAWQRLGQADDRRHLRNTYRVLLTRARYQTVIWIPPGCAGSDARHDATRPAAEMDAIAAFLRECGAAPLLAAASVVPALP
ncbi:MAG TPA: DNA/RNA helicase domain-containing protein [Roseococcus sp.]|nr:DNA/RNA helicase domain-containing protein [Roseococcus sp.]